MKKTIKTKLAIGAFAALIGASFMLPGTGFAMTPGQLEDQWGKPTKIEKLDKGGEKRYYALNTASSGKLAAYRIFEITADGKVLDKGFSDGYFQSQWGVTQ